MAVVAAAVEKVAGGFGFTEGPVWLAEQNAVLFTDIPRNRIMRWSDDAGVNVWLQGSHFAIGLARAADGRILACEHTTRSLTALQIRPDGTPGGREVLARGVVGVPLNSTNDVTVAPDGRILFTDPPFGVRESDGELVGYQQAMERPCDVLAVAADPDDAQVVVTGLYRPNGLCLSPDGTTLYVTDSSDRHHDLRVTDLAGTPPEVLWTMPVGVPDGLRADVDGRLWIAGGDGVYVVSPDGRQLGHVPVPEMVTNLCFAGEDLTTIYITATSGLYRTYTDVPGVAGATA